VSTTSGALCECVRASYKSEGGTLGYTCIDNSVSVCVQVTRRVRVRGRAEKESESESDRVGRCESGALALTHTRLWQR
jgi:hypothetical protein